MKLDPEKNYVRKPFLSYGEGYGYDVVKALGKHAFKELGDPDALKKVVDGLEKGNLVPVTYVKGGNEEKVAVAANPQYKAVDLYGMDGRKVFVENAVKAEVSEKPVNGVNRCIGYVGDQPAASTSGVTCVALPYQNQRPILFYKLSS